MPGNVLVIVTGASRGLGRCLAQEAVKQIGSKSSMTLLLMARSSDGLMETAASVQGANKEDVTIDVKPIDLGDMANLEASLQSAFSSLDASQYQRCILFNNAGSLGELGPVMDLSWQGMRQAVDLNVTSAMWVTSSFVNLIVPRWQVDDPKKVAAAQPDVIVNISSLAAVKPFQTWSVYCAGKAARDMFHQTLALEHLDTQLSVLNYAPGPLHTDMQAQIRGDEGCAPELKKFFCEAHQGGSLVSPSDSAAKCVRLVCEGSYKSGSHVDFYDD